MTSNQIAFARLQEDKRHNVETEKLNRDTYSEGARHNLQTERQNWYSVESNATIGFANVGINKTNAKSLSKNADSAWLNAQTNAINAQTNIVNAKTMEGNMRINQEQADTAKQRMLNDFEFGRLNIQNSWKDLDISYQNMLTQRDKVTNEFTIGMGNLVVNRQRVANDYIIGMANVAVGQQANVIRQIQVGQEGNRNVNQYLQYNDNLKETKRHNLAMESVAQGNLTSTEGYNASATTRNYFDSVSGLARAAAAFMP